MNKENGTQNDSCPLFNWSCEDRYTSRDFERREALHRIVRRLRTEYEQLMSQLGLSYEHFDLIYWPEDYDDLKNLEFWHVQMRNLVARTRARVNKREEERSRALGHLRFVERMVMLGLSAELDDEKDFCAYELHERGLLTQEERDYWAEDLWDETMFQYMDERDQPKDQRDCWLDWPDRFLPNASRVSDRCLERWPARRSQDNDPRRRWRRHVRNLRTT